MKEYKVGQRGTLPDGRIVYIARKTEVKDVRPKQWKYWSVDEENGMPGNGSMTVIDTGSFTPDDEPVHVIPTCSERQSAIPEFIPLMSDRFTR